MLIQTTVYSVKFVLKLMYKIHFLYSNQCNFFHLVQKLHKFSIFNNKELIQVMRCWISFLPLQCLLFLSNMSVT